MITSAHQTQANELQHAHGATADIRTRRPMSIWAIAFPLLVLLFGAAPASGDTPVTLFQSIAGNINITGTGGTLRTNPDTINSCTVVNNGSMTLSGVPAGATVRTAYLYWAGSGGDPQGGVGTDYNVTFNGTAVTADRTYTAWYNAGGGNVVYFFGGAKDVTSQVTGNGVYTFSNLTVQTANVGGGGQYCGSAAVLSAFSLMVIYDDPAEILHVVNIWEGFQGYRGAAITLTPTNFIVPTPAPVTPLSSRILILTWEGDSGNSGALGGFNENLTFCSPSPCAGTALTDAYNPLNNQFNSTIDIPPSGPFSGIDTAWGNDIDLYDLTTRIPAAAASAQSVYSSGGDLVILMNQTMSIPNVPVADLAVTKSHAGNFTVGTNGVYTLGGITNNGPNNATGTITVTDTLPAGLTYSSATGTGWTCGAVGQTVTCTRPGPMANGATAPDITLTVSVGAAAYPAVTNTVSVASADFDNIAANSTNVGDPTIVVAPDLSTSTKTWQDLNGGDQDPNDVLRYTISVIESAGILATGVTVTDTFPATLTNLSVVTCPAGATCIFAGQTLTVSSLTVTANGTAAIVISSTIAGGTAVGTLINNCATVTSPAGAGAAPCASTITVSASAIPSRGNKQLYFYGGATPALSRSTAGNTANVAIAINAVQTWTQDIPLQLPVTLDPASANVRVFLWLSNTTNARTRTVTVTLSCGAISLTQTPNITLNIAPSLVTFTFPYAGTQTCAAGNAWTFTLNNNNFNRVLTAYPVNGSASYAYIPSVNVINAGPVTAYSTPYPGVIAPASFTTGTVYLRTTVSDPFGSADIASAAVTIKDPATATQINLAPMPVVASNASTKTFEYAYLPVPPAASGFWDATVVAQEGLVSEGTPTHSRVGAFKVEPSLMLVKSALAVWDPINLGAGPKLIPGAELVYTVNLQNSSYGSVDADSLVLTDAIPANTVMCAAAACFNTPVQTSCLTPPCGLTFAYPADVAYSCSAPATPCPNPDAAGWSANVTGISINPKSSLYGTAVPASPKQYNMLFKVKIK